MSGKLTKAQLARREKLVLDLSREYEALEIAVNEYNNTMEDAWTPVDEALGKYNALVQEAAEFAEEIRDELQADFDDKSEKWQESEKGQAVEEMISSWENHEIEPVVIEPPSTLDFSNTEDMGYKLEGLPEDTGF